MKRKALILVGMLAMFGFVLGCSGGGGSDDDEDRSRSSDRSRKSDDDDDGDDSGYDPSGRAHGSGSVDGDWYDYDDSEMPPLEIPDDCEMSCAKERGEHSCFRDNKDICRECADDGHCEKNAMAWGPKCDTQNMMCVCEDHDDCADRALGRRCLPVGNFMLCTCRDDDDCAEPHSKCVGEVIRRCAEPCNPGDPCRYYYGGPGICDDDGECRSTMPEY